MALIYFLGYLVAIPSFSSRSCASVPPKAGAMTLSITAVTWTFVYVVFIIVMGAPLHEGLVWKVVGL